MIEVQEVFPQTLGAEEASYRWVWSRQHRLLSGSRAVLLQSYPSVNFQVTRLGPVPSLKYKSPPKNSLQIGVTYQAVWEELTLIATQNGRTAPACVVVDFGRCPQRLM